MDMSKLKKKEFPSQTENRKQWIIDTVRANQEDVYRILFWLNHKPANFAFLKAGDIFNTMHKHDRDALLQPNGILTPEQIEILKDE